MQRMTVVTCLTSYTESCWKQDDTRGNFAGSLEPRRVSETYSGQKMDPSGFLEISANKAPASRVAVADKGSEVVVTIA